MEAEDRGQMTDAQMRMSLLLCLSNFVYPSSAVRPLSSDSRIV
jgi:hypothetical protein